MKTREKLSVVIPTYNSARTLSDCLDSVKWVDEIILVDMGSTDSTIEIARKYRAQILRRVPEEGNFDQNRRLGMLKAQGDWILKLDSDEILSTKLQDEIKNLLTEGTNPSVNGYYVLNKIYMFGREVRHGFVKPGSNEMRLVRRDRWHYDPYRFHQQIVVDGETRFLTNYYYHYNYRSVGEFLEKMNRYTSLDAKYLSKERKITNWQVATAALKSFVKLYLIQTGFLDRRLGVEVSLLYSIYNLAEKVKLWEIQNS